MSHNCVLCKVLFCKSCFCGAEAEQKPNMPFLGKMCVRLERSFSPKIPLFFVAVGEEQPTEREGNCVAKAGVAAAENERSERKAEGGRRKPCRPSFVAVVCQKLLNTGTIYNSLSSVKTTPVILNGSHSDNLFSFAVLN